jgi:glycosyltransferase involved in cell wall biosynthesis/SAM-dependent methyltransferase
MKYSIVIYGESFSTGGLQKVASQASIAFEMLGYDVSIFLKNPDNIAFSYSGTVYKADVESAEAKQILRECSYIVDFCWHQAKWEPFATYIIQKHRHKLIATVHNTKTVSMYLDFFNKENALNQLFKIVCVSKAVARAVREKYGSLQNCAVIYNPIDPLTDRLSLEKNLVTREKPYFLFVGRIQAAEQKGVDILLKSWAESGLGKSYDLVMLGDDGLPETISALIKDLDISTSVTHVPFTPHVSEWMKKACALVLPSRWEGFGLVLVEAMHTGTPCIASRCDGPLEIINDEENGLLVDVEDICGLAQTMRRMAMDEGLRKRLGQNAAASVEKFSFANYMNNWHDILNPIYRQQGATTDLQNDLTPVFSIQLPVFNKSKYLRECLDSILMQTFTDFEVICVDDRSCDNSWKILQSYAAKDKRFKVFKNKKNRGTLQTRKRCFEEARGQYMVFIDADDKAASTLLEDTLAYARKYNADFIQYAATVDNSTNCLSSATCSNYNNYLSEISEKVLAGEDVFLSLGLQVRTLLWKSMLKRSVYKAILPHIPDGCMQHGNDNLLIYMFSFFAQKYVSINKQLYFFRANETSSNLIEGLPPQKLLEHLESRSRCLRFIRRFMDDVQPGWAETDPPFSLWSRNLIDYTVTLMRRCLKYYPEHTAEITFLFVKCFGDNTPKYIFDLNRDACLKSPQKREIMQETKPNPIRVSRFSLSWISNLLRSQVYAHRIAKSGLFLADFYLSENPDVKKAGMKPLLHYCRHGWREGRAPNPYFNTGWYMQQNSDVSKTGMNPLIHYINFGWREGRSPSPDFPISVYYQIRPDVKAAAKEPLKHFLLYGINEGAVLKSFTPKMPNRPQAVTINSDLIQSAGQSHSAPQIKVSSSSNHQEFRTILNLSTHAELKEWFYKYPELIKQREQMQGYSEKDFVNSNLKLIQDLAVYDFIKKHIPKGSRILEIGGGYSRILEIFKKDYECWNLEKFEGIGNGPTAFPQHASYKLVQNYIGAFDKELPDSFFDLVFSISVFEHLNIDKSDLDNITNDIDRILKPGGFSVHCMDVRFNAKYNDLTNRKMVKHIIEHHGFSQKFILDNYKNPEVFTMSGKAYDRFWKKACNNRPHELDGLPFNVFLAAQKPHTVKRKIPLTEQVISDPKNVICGSARIAPGNSAKPDKCFNSARCREEPLRVNGVATVRSHI